MAFPRIVGTTRTPTTNPEAYQAGVTLTLPETSADYYLCFLSIFSTSTLTISVPTGWTLVGATGTAFGGAFGGDGQGMAVYSATGTPDLEFSWGPSTRLAAATVVALAGTGIGVEASAFGGNQTAPNISDTVDGLPAALVIRASSVAASPTATIGTLLAGSWASGTVTELAETQVSSARPAGQFQAMTQLVGSEEVTSGGAAVGSVTWSGATIDTNADSGGASIMLEGDGAELPVVANAGDRLRSSISETTGSLLEAVDVRAVDASVSEAYTYAQRLEAATLTSYREALRARDSATVDFAYYPRPRQNVVMENQYSGVTLLSRLSTYFPQRILDTVDTDGLGITASVNATASEIIDYVLSVWAADTGWLTYEPVPDLRVRMPGLTQPSEYTIRVGVATSFVVAIPQDGNNRKDALTILKELLSPFPGTVVRQNSSGKLEIVPAYGPDADATPFLTLGTRDLYTVSIGEPDPFGIVNRCTVTSSGYERSANAETMQPAYFQIGSILNFGKANWYTPDASRVNLQPPTTDGDIFQEADLTSASSFNAQVPGLWPISTSSLPAGTGISLQDAGLASTITAAYKYYNDTSLGGSGAATVTLTQTSIPFDGVWRDTIRLDIAGANIYSTIACRWNAARNGVEFRFGSANKFEQNCFIPPCEAYIFEVTLNDSSDAFVEGASRSGTFGVVDDPTTPTADDDTLPATDGGNAVAESQVEYGILERNISIEGYVFSASQLAEIARGYVIQNITPKVVRDLDVAALSGYRVTFDSIGRTVQLPNGEIGKLTGVQYSDDFIGNSARKTATVEVANPLGAGAIPALTLYHLAEDGDYWVSEAGDAVEREEGTAASPLAGGGTGGATTPGTDPISGSSSTSTSTATYPITADTTAGDWFVDPAAGNDGNAGTTSGAAFLTLEAALAVAADGDTILVRAGTLTPTSRYSRTTSWATGINVWNYGTERPIIDASALAGGSAARVIRLAGAREHWKGFEVINSAEIPVYIEGSNNTVEDLWVHDNAREAIYIFGSGAADNIVQDSVCWRNGLVSDGGTNAPDGIVCTASSGTITSGHAIVRCFVANASDDAFDLFRGNGCIIWDCVAFEAGLHYSAGNQGGDGNGYKAGGGDAGVGDNTVRGCLAVNCRVQGFDPNLSPVACSFEFNTASGNQYGFGLGTEGHTLDSNLAFGNLTLNSWSGTATEILNSWNLGTGDPLFVNPTGFDWSLGAGSPAIGAGTAGENLGASDLALELALEWCGVV